MSRKFPTVLLALSVLAVSVHAEDWTTTDGKSYQDVKVIKVDPDVVTILHRDGGASVPLATLPSYLQTRFKYEPAKAQAAAAARAQADQESIKELQAEKDKENAQNVAAAQGMARAVAESKKNAAANATMPATAASPIIFKPLGTPAGNCGNTDAHVDPNKRDTQQQDPRTHYTGI